MGVKLLMKAVAVGAGVLAAGIAGSAESCRLWYDKPAEGYGLASPLKSWTHEKNKKGKHNPDPAWEHYALPLGNGFIGAMVYGGVARERFQLNEHSLWTGGPGTPGWSPEHGKISLGTTADIAMAREALKDALAAAATLGISDDEIEDWQGVMQRLVPYKIGKYGQLQEWYEDRDDPKSHHRHINHLFGLYPGTQIDPAHTPKLAQACRVTLTQRGDGATGWSMGWKINFWARMRDGDHAYKMVHNLLSHGTTFNLFDEHPPFKIDGNFGGCAGIAEMLVQSRWTETGAEITLLPALPKAWESGEVKGLGASRAFTVDESWQDGKLTGTVIHSRKGGEVTVNYAGKSLKFKLKAGESRRVDII